MRVKSSLLLSVAGVLVAGAGILVFLHMPPRVRWDHAVLFFLPKSNCQPTAISANGTWVVGIWNFKEPFVWSHETGLRIIEGLPAHEEARAKGVADDGTTVGFWIPQGQPQRQNGFEWSPARGMILYAGGEGAIMNAVTADRLFRCGSVMVQGVWRAATFDATGKPNLLSKPDSRDTDSRAMAMTRDGLKAVGSSRINSDYCLPILWSNGRPTILRAPAGLSEGVRGITDGAYSISADGTVISGNVCGQPVTWQNLRPKLVIRVSNTAASLVFCGPPALAGDGRTGTGGSVQGASERAYVFSLGGEPTDIGDALAAAGRGAMLGDHRLCEGRAVSQDGRVIVGLASEGKRQKTFILRFR